MADQVAQLSYLAHAILEHVLNHTVRITNIGASVIFLEISNLSCNRTKVLQSLESHNFGKSSHTVVILEQFSEHGLRATYTRASLKIWKFLVLTGIEPESKLWRDIILVNQLVRLSCWVHTFLEQFYKHTIRGIKIGASIRFLEILSIS